MKNLPLLVPCLTFATIVNGATLTLDFETGTSTDNQKTGNFRAVRNSGNLGQTDPADVGEPNNDWLTGTRPGGGSDWQKSTVAIYDTTPVNADDVLPTFGTGPIKIDFRMAASGNNQAVGIYLIDTTLVTVNDVTSPNINNNLFARFAINADAGSTDRMTFSRDGSVTGGNSGETFIQPTSSVGGDWSGTYNSIQQSGAGSANFSDNIDPTWYYLTLTYTPGTNNDTTLELAYKGTSPTNEPSFSGTVTITNTERINNPGLAFFLHNTVSTAGYTVKVDDISVTYGTIPEPSTYGILLAGIVGGMMAFSRRRRI